jgi:hypothetical protein
MVAATELDAVAVAGAGAAEDTTNPRKSDMMVAGLDLDHPDR